MSRADPFIFLVNTCGPIWNIIVAAVDRDYVPVTDNPIPFSIGSRCCVVMAPFLKRDRDLCGTEQYDGGTSRSVRNGKSDKRVPSDVGAGGGDNSESDSMRPCNAKKRDS